MSSGLRYPTPRHEEVALAASSFFGGRAKAVLVTASCARGAAVPASDLDMIALVEPSEVASVQRAWDAQRAATAGDFTLHLDVVDGVYEPTVWDDGGGPDDFELNVGNHVAYSALLWERGSAFSELEERWLPYYSDALAHDRLAMVREACIRDLDFMAFYVDRGLYFQAFDRLYKAFREFLQALMISRRTYAISYSKWIRYQIVDLLGEPALYEMLAPVLEVPELEGTGILRNRERLSGLVGDWLS
jgi:hypothetical protein